MEQNLEFILNKLNIIQVDLRKLGPTRRLKYEGKVNDKILEAEKLFLTYKDIINIIAKQESKVELVGYVYEVLKERIEFVYNKILTYKINCTMETSKSDITKMDKFDIKTAISLIPVMDNTEETIEKIIDGIEMYDEYLVNVTQKKLLISFVLKTRLTKTAKLKLKSEYDDVMSLIQDIRDFLLTKKSANAILSRLNNLSQNNMSIREYGDKLSELFVGLTIAQSDGNPKSCEILRPINENLAIKRFADGLRNRRLSTIISARNYSELKDAVRAAEDEELGQLPSSNNIFNVQRRGNQPPYYRSSLRGRGGRMNTRGNFYSNHRRNYNNFNNYTRGKYVNNNYNRGYNNGRSTRGYRDNFVSSSRGRGNSSSGNRNQRNICSAQVESTTQEKTTELNQFFRT